MPRTKPPTKNQTKTRLPSEEPVPMNPEMQRRFDELAVGTAIDLDCTICRQGRGVPKVVHRDIRLCFVCYRMLSKAQPYKRTWVTQQAIAGKLNLDKWQALRLPFFRDWLTSENRMHSSTEKERNTHV